MSIDYKFNQYRVSGETALEITQKGYRLFRAGRGVLSGQEVGSILYRHFINGESAEDIFKSFKGISPYAITSVVSGRFSPEGFDAFFDLLETEPEQLDKMFKGAVKNG